MTVLYCCAVWECNAWGVVQSFRLSIAWCRITSDASFFRGNPLSSNDNNNNNNDNDMIMIMMMIIIIIIMMMMMTMMMMMIMIMIMMMMMILIIIMIMIMITIIIIKLINYTNTELSPSQLSLYTYVQGLRCMHWRICGSLIRIKCLKAVWMLRGMCKQNTRVFLLPCSCIIIDIEIMQNVDDMLSMS